MSAAARLAGGALVLIVYAWALKPVPASVSSADTRSDVDVEQWLALSNDAYAAGRYADALEPTSRLVARFPLQQAYAERLARIFGKLNRAADEAAAWERFIDMSPTPIDACPAIGDAYARAGQPQKSLEARAAVRLVRSAQQRAALLPRPRLRACGTDRRRHGSLLGGRGDRSVECRRPARPRPPRSSRRSSWPTAKGAADKVLARFPANADALLLAGLVAERQSRPQDARRDFERALAAAPDYVDVHIALGRVEAGAGRRAEARRHFERALELDPSRRADAHGVARARRGGLADANRLEPRDRRRVLVRHGRDTVC